MEIEDLAAITASPEQLARIGNLAAYQRSLEDQVDNQEKTLKELKSRLRQVREVDIPDALAEAGLESITTTDGHKIEVETKLFASVAKKNLPQVCAWLADHGHGSLIKPKLEVAFSNGEQESMAIWAESLEGQGLRVSTVESVNTTSLKAMIRELSAEGADLPLDLFGAHWVRQSTIK